MQCLTSHPGPPEKNEYYKKKKLPPYYDLFQIVAQSWVCMELQKKTRLIVLIKNVSSTRKSYLNGGVQAWSRQSLGSKEQMGKQHNGQTEDCRQAARTHTTLFLCQERGVIHRCGAGTSLQKVNLANCFNQKQTLIKQKRVYYDSDENCFEEREGTKYTYSTVFILSNKRQ